MRSRRIVAVASWELAEEIVDVLRRPKLARYGITEADVEQVVALLRPLLPTTDVDVPLRDADDVPVVAAAVAGFAEFIVTGDSDFLDDRPVRDWLRERHRIEVVTAAEALARLE